MIAEIKKDFEDLLGKKAESFYHSDNQLDEACLYSLLGGGKRIRPLLTMVSCRQAQGHQDWAKWPAMALEMIHCFSLIHDDLPAMDDDDLRRGRPTNHKVFGEAQAILAGDALALDAIHILIEGLTASDCPPQLALSLVSDLVFAASSKGMILGQSLDMAFENTDISGFDRKELLEILEKIHINKTGRLLSLAFVSGAKCAPENQSLNIELIKCIGNKIGLAFQIIDDLLDVIGDSEKLGKTPGKDLSANKMSYMKVYDEKHARKLAIELIRECTLLIPKAYGRPMIPEMSEIFDLLKNRLF